MDFNTDALSTQFVLNEHVCEQLSSVNPLVKFSEVGVTDITPMLPAVATKSKTPEKKPVDAVAAAERRRKRVKALRIIGTIGLVTAGSAGAYLLAKRLRRAGSTDKTKSSLPGADNAKNIAPSSAKSVVPPADLAELLTSTKIKTTAPDEQRAAAIERGKARLEPFTNPTTDVAGTLAELPNELDKVFKTTDYITDPDVVVPGAAYALGAPLLASARHMPDAPVSRQATPRIPLTVPATPESLAESVRGLGNRRTAVADQIGRALSTRTSPVAGTWDPAVVDVRPINQILRANGYNAAPANMPELLRIVREAPTPRAARMNLDAYLSAPGRMPIAANRQVAIDQIVNRIVGESALNRLVARAGAGQPISNPILNAVMQQLGRTTRLTPEQRQALQSPQAATEPANWRAAQRELAQRSRYRNINRVSGSALILLGLLRQLKYLGETAAGLPPEQRENALRAVGESASRAGAGITQ